MRTFVALWFLFLPSLIISECDLGGTWSTWRMGRNQTGYDYCGSCWRANLVRECLSEPGCPCSGTNTYTAVMASPPCSPPRKECCFDLEVSGEICGNPTEFPPDEPVRNLDYCPPSGTGIWGSWSEWETCSASCGMFGTKKRTRTCLSAGYGCPCHKSEVNGECQTAPCPETPCPGEICSVNIVSSFDGKEKYCSPFEGKIPDGTWTEWTPVSNAECNTTCDKISMILTSTRDCNPSGSNCPGEYSSYQPCPPDMCPSYPTGQYYGIDKCPPNRVPALNYQVPPGSYPGAKDGSGSINASFISCQADDGYGIMIYAMVRGSYGGDTYLGGNFVEQDLTWQFVCNGNDKDKIWGQLEFYCLHFRIDGDETVRQNLLDEVKSILEAKY